MAWRFKASKYKNAAPKFLKKEENITDLPVTDISMSCGNHIKSSCVYTVFNTDLGGGGSLGYLPVTTRGRRNGSVPLILAHSDFVTDFDFSPFDDYLLASCSMDNKVKVWLLPEETAASENVSDPALSLPTFDRRVENVLWNPSADGILAVSTSTMLKIYDVTGAGANEVFSFSDHGDQVQSISWQENGNSIVTSCKDKKIRVIDVRANKTVQECTGHQGVKDSRVLWLSGKNHIVSTGFSSLRNREASVWDPRNLSNRLNIFNLGASTGVMMPFFDTDTGMTFLIGKGDISINFLEYTDKDPYLTETKVDRTEQIKGACLVPKRAMSLMEGEVNRFMLLCQRTILPVPYIVPRKSYRDFHDDIYPDTIDGYPGMTAEQWANGESALPSMVKLQPGKTLIHQERRGVLIGQNGSASSSASAASSPKVTPPSSSSQPAPSSAVAKQTEESVKAPIEKKEPVQKEPSPKPINSTSAISKKESKPAISTEKPAVSAEKPTIPQKTSKPFAGVRQSKYRHIEGHLQHASCFYTNLRNVSTTIPGESNMFAANETRCAVPLEGAGGCIQILDFSKARRLQDSGEMFIQNGAKVSDFAWDPFDNTRLVVTLDSARINVWRFPEQGLTESMDEPEFCLKGHNEKVFFVQFHPLVSDLIATASYDMTVRLWNLKEREEVFCFEGDEDQQAFCLSWSQDGRYFATVHKDKKIRVFDPRNGSSPIKEGPGPEGSRGARVLWALDDKFLVVTGFDRSSCQEIIVYKSDELKIVNRVLVINSPAILVPFYDPDCSLLLVTSRGERTIYSYEVSEEEPHLFEGAFFKMESLHQAASYLWKRACDVRKVEVAKGWRLTSNSIEAINFTIPRVKPEYFQDDLFPDTAVVWKPYLTAEEWLAGKDKKPEYISLRPTDMKPLSEAPVQAPKAKKYESFNSETFKTDEQKKEELLNAMVGKLEMSSDPLPQDLAEGVDDDEWDD